MIDTVREGVQTLLEQADDLLEQQERNLELWREKIKEMLGFKQKE